MPTGVVSVNVAKRKEEVMLMEPLRNRQIDFDQFQKMRVEVLSGWPTGRDADLEEAVQYHRSLPPAKVLAHKVSKAVDEGTVLLSALAGVALLDEHIELLQALRVAGCDFVPTTIDSHTRWQDYRKAEAGLAESKTSARSMLNGFPAINYGVQGCRQVTESVEVPVMCRQSAVDPRLLTEVVLAGGFNGLVGSQMSAFSCYSRRQTLEECIRNYQYVERLCGYYTEHGAPIFRDLTRYNIGAGGHPPSVAISMGIFSTLLAAEQGVRHMCVTHCQQGSIPQNVAAIVVEEKLIREYLDRFGYRDTRCCEELVSFLGAFPVDEANGYAILIAGAITASLAGANIMISKSAMEGFGLPTRECNAASMRAMRYALDMTRHQRMPEGPDFLLEMQMIEKEVRLIVEKALELGDGDPAVGLVRAFEAGTMDCPFSPNMHVANRILPAKDCTGAVRYLDCGNIPFTQEIREYHREKLEERARRDGRALDLSLAIDDVLAGMLVAPPRGTSSSRV